MSAVEVRNLGRKYRSSVGRRGLEVEAVKDISFDIERGKLFGLLGPNGAGKTTTIKMLITLLLPTTGVARVDGYDVVKNPTEVRRRIGYAFGGDRGLYDRLSAYDNLRYFAELYSVPAREQRARIATLIEMVGLEGRERERVEGYSRGMRQRLHIARALLHKPSVLFLDEPSIGIDPVGAQELRSTVSQLVDSGTTVLLTTHYMFEADQLCDHIGIIAKGRMVAMGTPVDLKARVSTGHVLEIEVFEDVAGHLEHLRSIPGVKAVAVENRGHAFELLLHTTGQEQGLALALRALSDLHIGRVATREPTLEDAYIEIVNSQ